MPKPTATPTVPASAHAAVGHRAPQSQRPPVEYFEVEGGQRLSGTVQPQGAKNEALQVIAATLLSAEPVTLRNLPDILDVNRLIDLLRDLGASVTPADNTGHTGMAYTFQAQNLRIEQLKDPEVQRKITKLRGSVMLIGPLLARYGAVHLPKPGGDKIGRRRIDVHLSGMEALGASIDYDARRAFFSLQAKQLKGTYMHLEEASVTGTANIVMAAVLAEGETTIYNAACEPYLQQLCRMLVRMGAKIEGLGSNLLRITGVKELGGTEHTLLADMIEVGSFIGMAAMTRSELRIANAGVADLGVIPGAFRKLGVEVTQAGADDLLVDGTRVCEIQTYRDGGVLTLADHPWPGLTPDLLSVLLVTATQCRGVVLIHQKMFESRLFFVDKLIDMGAQIILNDPHRATVIGLGHDHPLRGIRMSSPDIRAGVALLIAALSAHGTSRIDNIEQIDRGYQDFDSRLRALGAQVVRKREG